MGEGPVYVCVCVCVSPGIMWLRIMSVDGLWETE